ncbi:MAG: anti-sigma factor family protein, partial [Chloroflexota bacterium]
MMVAEVVRREACPAGHDEGLLKTYLDGELPAAWREQMDVHVQGCASCRDRLAQLRLDGALVQGRLNLLARAPAGDTAESAAPARPDVGAVLA